MNHPITGKPFNYDLVCRTCVHFSDKIRNSRSVKYRTTTCALDPENRNLANIVGVSWAAHPACSQHKH